MAAQCDLFLDDLDLLIQSKHLLKHPFYLAWSKGELSLECLKEYAKEYYQHVKAFPTYLSALHSHTENAATRKVLLQNLVEEEAGSPNHPDLWKNFALQLGVSDEELSKHTPNGEIAGLIATFRKACNQGTTAEGIASLYAYESQIPEICVSKIDGLKRHYGIENPKGWEYFSVHIAADKEHAADERKLLSSYVNHDNMKMVREAADKVLDALWNFLSSLCDRYKISCHYCS
jgi:pyrroloquinoline-quinone synthase